ncbi:MAG: thioredoxin domain-containing protein [Planctomycetota bacterium]
MAVENKREVNRLIHEKSPYLRQHAYNPVDWFPWGKEAFDKAAKEDKPIFLSIGYSSCHWCHVMEHESFDDDEVAAILNEKFVCIKVDREERPDVDEVYMNAISLVLRRQGGWPLSVWMTPQGKPFEGGTYFPKTARMGMPGFIDVLNAIAKAWADPETRKKIEADGSRIADFVQEVYDMEEPEALGAETLESAREMAEAQFDETYGGFGWPPRFAPKFPSSSSLELMLRWALRKKDKTAMKVVDKSLEAMAHGGIHDHVGGGFHRYSTTRDWLVPHFEKMLYDNAQLLGLYAWAHLATGRTLYAETARDIARWVQVEMTDPKGGFFSAQDADDPGGPEGEGGFYVWDPAAIGELFDETESKVLSARFDITEQGNWPERPGKSLLQVVRTKEEVAKTCGVKPEEVEAILERCIRRMYDVREKRPKPMTDTKVLSGWNGLMISGFAKAYQALGETSYLDSALAAGRFLRKELIKEGRLQRRWAEGEAAHDAVAADYAYVIAAFLDLYESTFEIEWLEEALRLNRKAVELFYDPKEGGFFFTAKDGEKLIARGKSGFDQARPSGNGVMALNLLRIAELSGDMEAREKAKKTLDYFGARVSQAALGFSAVLNALDFMQKDTREIFIAGPMEDPATRALIDAVWKDPSPNRVVALVTPGVEKLLPPAKGKVVVDGKPAAYVCRNFTCAAPVTDPKLMRD